MHNMTLLGKLPAILLAMAAAIGSGTTISAGSADGIAADGTDASSEGSGAPEEWTGNFSISLSSKNLDRGEWGPSRNQSELGFEVTWGRTHWPLLIATDFLVSNDRQVESAEGDPFTTITVREAFVEKESIPFQPRRRRGLHPGRAQRRGGRLLRWICSARRGMPAAPTGDSRWGGTGPPRCENEIRPAPDAACRTISA